MTEHESKRKPLNIGVPDEPENPTGTAVVAYDFGQDVGAGMENVGSDEYRLPFLRILHYTSPEVEDGSPNQLPGAKAGMVINNSTRELYDGEKGIVIVPCYRDGGKFLRWTKRDAGSGFVGIYENDDPLVLELRAKHGKFGKLPIPDTNDELVQSFSLYCLLLPGDGLVSRAIVSFESTKIGAYNTFMDRYMGPAMKYRAPQGAVVTPPLWAHRWLLRTVKAQNKKGKWFNYELTLAEKNADGTEKPKEASFIKMGSELYSMGREFYTLIKEGKVKVDYASSASGDNERPVEDGEIPL